MLLSWNLKRWMRRRAQVLSDDGQASGCEDSFCSTAYFLLFAIPIVIVMTDDISTCVIQNRMALIRVHARCS